MVKLPPVAIWKFHGVRISQHFSIEAFHLGNFGLFVPRHHRHPGMACQRSKQEAQTHLGRCLAKKFANGLPIRRKIKEGLTVRALPLLMDPNQVLRERDSRSLCLEDAHSWLRTPAAPSFDEPDRRCPGFDQGARKRGSPDGCNVLQPIPHSTRARSR